MSQPTRVNVGPMYPQQEAIPNWKQGHYDVQCQGDAPKAIELSFDFGGAPPPPVIHVHFDNAGLSNLEKLTIHGTSSSNSTVTSGVRFGDMVVNVGGSQYSQIGSIGGHGCTSVNQIQSIGSNNKNVFVNQQGGGGGSSSNQPLLTVLVAKATNVEAHHTTVQCDVVEGAVSAKHGSLKVGHIGGNVSAHHGNVTADSIGGNTTVNFGNINTGGGAKRR